MRSIILVFVALAAFGNHPTVSRAQSATPPRLLSSINEFNAFYPPASRRLGETGRVVVHFAVTDDGRVQFPVATEALDSSSPRFVVAVEKILHQLRFAASETERRTLTASFVFELQPCEFTHPSNQDYTFNICGKLPCTEFGADLPSDPLKAALRTVLEHGDLSDIQALSGALDLDLHVRSDSSNTGQLLQYTAVARKTPPYLFASDFSYTSSVDLAQGTTRVELGFRPRFCPNICRWGDQWKQRVSGSTEQLTEGWGTEEFDTLQWGGPAGIELAVSSNVFGCSGVLRQEIPRAVTFPPSPARPGNLEADVARRIAEAVAGGDLRRVEYLSHSLGAELVPHVMAGSEDTGALLAQSIPGIESARVGYSAYDTGWTSGIGPLFRVPRQLAERTVDMELPVDTDQVCVVPASIGAELSRRSIPYTTSKNITDLIFSIRSENLITLTATVLGGCVAQFTLHQVTDIAHSFETPLTFSPRDSLGTTRDSVGETAQAKIDVLALRLQNATLTSVEIVETRFRGVSGSELRDVHRLAVLVKRALIAKGIREGIINVRQDSRDERANKGSPTAVVTVDAFQK